MASSRKKTAVIEANPVEILLPPAAAAKPRSSATLAKLLPSSVISCIEKRTASDVSQSVQKMVSDDIAKARKKNVMSKAAAKLFDVACTVTTGESSREMIPAKAVQFAGGFDARMVRMGPKKMTYVLVPLTTGECRIGINEDTMRCKTEMSTAGIERPRKGGKVVSKSKHAFEKKYALPLGTRITCASAFVVEKGGKNLARPIPACAVVSIEESGKISDWQVRIPTRLDKVSVTGNGGGVITPGSAAFVMPYGGVCTVSGQKSSTTGKQERKSLECIATKK